MAHASSLTDETTPPAPQRRDARVLIVEHDRTARHKILDLCRTEGMEVAEAAERDAALLAVLDWHPSVVVINLATGGNLEGLISTMRKSGPDLRFIVRTGHPASVAVMHSAGDAVVAIREFDFGELVAAIRTAHAQ